jgi:hypothetical protein
MFSAKIREKSIGKVRSMRLLAVLLVPVAVLILGAAVPEGWAQEEEFDEAEVSMTPTATWAFMLSSMENPGKNSKSRTPMVAICSKSK